MEVLQGRNGLNRISCVLEDKQRVISRVTLWGIPHESNPRGLGLKIGRYIKNFMTIGGKKYPSSESPETLEPKSELTLNETESRELLSFLSENANLVMREPGEYVQLPQNDMRQLFTDFATRISGASETELLLLAREGAILPENIASIVILAKREAAVRELENLILFDVVEKEYQKWFKENTWVFGSEFITILDQLDVSFDHQTDYIVKNYDGHADIIEIKRTSTQIWETNRDHSNLVPHAELTRALTQLNNYLFDLERKIDSKEMENKLINTAIARPRGLLIIVVVKIGKMMNLLLSDF